MRPLIPLFSTNGDVCQSQGGSLFACFLACVILRFTSGATPADCIEVAIFSGLFSVKLFVRNAPVDQSLCNLRLDSVLSLISLQKLFTFDAFFETEEVLGLRVNQIKHISCCLPPVIMTMFSFTN